MRVPETECLKDVLKRVVLFLGGEIVPDSKSGKTVLNAAHGSSLRALMKLLEGITDEEISGVESLTGVSIVYELG